MSNNSVENLREENTKLMSDLRFERKMNSILKNIRGLSLNLVNDCDCRQNSSRDDYKKYIRMNIIYCELEQSKSDSQLGINHS